MRDRKTKKRATNISTTIREKRRMLITRNAINEIYRSFNLLIRSIDAMAIVEKVTCDIYVPAMRN